MELAPPLKKYRPDGFSNGGSSGGASSYLGFGGPPEMDRKWYAPSGPEGFPSFAGDAGRHKPNLDSEKESLSTGLGSKSRACLKFFSTSGCPYGEGCHFSHYVPGGLASIGLSSLTGSAGLGGRKDAHSGFSMSHSDQGHAPGGYKSRLCKNFETPEGCRFGDKCHFAHGVKELRKPGEAPHTTERSVHSTYGRNIASPFESHLAARGSQEPAPPGVAVKSYPEPTPPGVGAAAAFGAISTAKISVDASLAGLIIGKAGVNARSICRSTGAKLSIRDHESDPNLKNIEMEGSFDQIKQASMMVRELLLQKDVTPTKPGGFGSHNYKTKLCENFPKGTCTFGDRCHFAHGMHELQQPSIPH